MNGSLPVSIPRYAPADLERAIHSAVCGMDYDLSELKRQHWTIFGGTRLPGIDVFRNEGVGSRRGQRTLAHIRRDQVKDVLISIPRQALIELHQNGTSLVLEPGTFAFCTTAVPCRFEIAPIDGNDTFTMTHVRVSGAALRERLPHIDACCHQRIQLRPGAGRVMESLLTVALSNGDEFTAGSGERFANLLLDAVANVVLDAPELENAARRVVTPAQRIRDTAIAFISRNLSDPALDVRQVAEYCNVSIRHLHEVFSGSGHTAASLIRTKRLEQCRRALRAPSLRYRSIMDIALDSGFNDLSGFSRAYKKQFGIAPSAERKASMPAGA